MTKEKFSKAMFKSSSETVIEWRAFGEFWVEEWLHCVWRAGDVA